MQILFPEHQPRTVTVANILIKEKADEHRNEELIPVPDMTARLSSP